MNTSFEKQPGSYRIAACMVMSIGRKLLLLYGVLLLLFTLLLVGVFAIPTSWVRSQVVESARYVEQEGLWFQPWGCYLFQVDNMTDCWMMNIAASADSDRPIRAAMLAEYAQPYNGEAKAYTEMPHTTWRVATDGRSSMGPLNQYGRYWHGYQVLLRPLLCLFHYRQLRVLNYIFLALLVGWVTTGLCRRLGGVYASTFLGTLLLFAICLVPLSFQLSTCFYLALLGMGFLLCHPSWVIRYDRLLLLFFALGAFTSYMDLLSTPLLTCGLPLVVAIALGHREGIGRHDGVTLLSCSLTWVFGYVSLWASKWWVTGILTGENVLDSALSSARLRVGDTIVFGGQEMSLSHFFDLIMHKVYQWIPPVGLLAVVVVAFVLVLVFLVRRRHALVSEGWLLWIALGVPFWFWIMKNHSLQHIFFTWRDGVLMVWCLLLFLFRTSRRSILVRYSEK